MNGYAISYQGTKVISLKHSFFAFWLLILTTLDVSGLELLEPEEGCLTGVNLAWSTETALQFNGEVLWDHVCFVDFTEFPLASYTNLDENIGQVRSVGGIYVATLEPGNAHGGLTSISSNDCQNFAGWCSYWNGQGVPIIVRFAHEMNGDWYDWKMQPQTYRDKFRLLADIVHNTATNTAMLWAPNVAGPYPYGVYDDMTRAAYTNGYGTPADWILLDSNGDGVLSNSTTLLDEPYEPFYPGDIYVDWVGMTVYHWGSYWPWHYNAWPEQRKLFDQITGNYDGFNGDNTWNPDFYAVYATGHNKPMMIPETSAYYRPADKPDPGGYPNYTNSETLIKQRWLEQVYNVSGDTSNALDVAANFPKLKSINWFNWYKIEAEAENDWVNWTITSNATVKAEYYDRLNAMKNGRRHFLHADDLAGYVYSWNSSLEGWTAGPAPFSVSVSTNAPYHGRACLQIDYDDSSSPYGVNVMSDISAMQDARSWSNFTAVYLRTKVPSGPPWATFRLIMQSSESNWDILDSVSAAPDGAWHNLTFPYAWTNHDASAWLNLYLQIDLPTGTPVTVYADGFQAVLDNDADGTIDADDPDDDNDGMLDSFENRYGLDPFNAADANIDADGDGHTNWQESHVDTNPTNANSVLELYDFALSAPEEVVLSWNGRSGITYHVQSSTAVTGTWGLVGSPLTPTTNAPVIVTNNSPSAPLRFYNLEVP